MVRFATAAVGTGRIARPEPGSERRHRTAPVLDHRALSVQFHLHQIRLGPLTHAHFLDCRRSPTARMLWPQSAGAGSDAKRPPTVWIIASCRLGRKGREAGVRPKSTVGFSLIDGKDSRARTTHSFPCRPELGNHLPATHGGPSSRSTEGDLIRLPGFRRLTRRVPAARAAAGLPQRSAALRAGSGWGRAALDPPVGRTFATLQAQLIPVLLYWVLGRFLFRSLRPLPCSRD